MLQAHYLENTSKKTSHKDDPYQEEELEIEQSNLKSKYNHGFKQSE